MSELQPHEDTDTSPDQDPTSSSPSPITKPDADKPSGTLEVEQVLQSFTALSSWSGPLPSPEAFAAYNEAQPGTSERLIKMAERQQLFQMLELVLSFGLIAFGIAGSIWGPGMGANPLAVGGLPLAAGLAVAAVTSARRFQRRPPSG